MTKALIFGSGAVGSVYGYILSKAGLDVIAVCRSNFDIIQANGIKIRSVLYGEVHYKPKAVKSVSEAQTYGPFDYLFVCSKAFPGTASKIREAVSSQTAIVIAQNGIGIEEEYRELYPSNPIISGVVWLPTTQTSPGVIEMGALERLEIGTYPSNAPLSDKEAAGRLAEIWRSGGGHAPLYEDVQEPRWSKLAINAAFNPMCALARCDGANLLLSSEEADTAVVKVLRDIAKIASAVGYNHMTEESIQKSMDFHRVRKLTGGKEPSMLVDVREGRPVEVEAILGNTLRIARKHGVDVPYLEMMYALTQAINFALTRPVGQWKEVDYLR